MVNHPYKEPNGTLRFPVSQIDAMYLRAAALKAGDQEAVNFFEDEAAMFLARDLEDGI